MYAQCTVGKSRAILPAPAAGKIAALCRHACNPSHAFKLAAVLYRAVDRAPAPSKSSARASCMITFVSRTIPSHSLAARLKAA